MQAIEIIDAKLENSTIHYTEETALVRQEINNGRIVILKNCFDVNMLMILKQAIHRWGQQHAVFSKRRSASIPNINFHRIDDAEMRSKLPHRFHQYGFGKLDVLDEQLRLLISSVAHPLLELQNSMAGTDYKLSDQQVRIKFLHYPCGGGYLANHSHPLHPQRVGLIVSLSEWQVDYLQGGNYFYTPNNGETYTSPNHYTGDVLLFRYDIPHEIKPIDPQQQLDWNSLAGKWSLVLELLQTHAQSNEVSGVN